MWNVALIVASDRALSGEREDESGPVIREMIVEHLHSEITAFRVLPDDIEILMENMIEITDRDNVDLLITIGGTGLSPEDVTPEATRMVIDRIIPGMAEEMRRKTMEHSRKAMLTRAICGTRRSTLIINLPGAKDSAQSCLQAIIDQLPLALKLLEREQGVHHE